MSHLAVIIPLPSSFTPIFSLLKTIDCQWREEPHAFLPLCRIGHCDNQTLLEEVDYELSRLRWSVFPCSIKHITFHIAPDGYKLGLTVTTSSSLLALRQKVNFALHRAGLEIPRKKFVPFIELGSMPAGNELPLKGWINQHALFPFPEFDVHHLALIEDYSTKTYGQFSLLEEYDSLQGRISNINHGSWEDLTNSSSAFKR